MINHYHYKQCNKIGEQIAKLGKHKTTFSTFVRNSDNNKIMVFLPNCERSMWSFPMSEDLRLRFDNNHDDLSKINDYDLSIVFVHRFGDTNDVLLEHDHGNIYNIVIQTINEQSFDNDLYGDILFGIGQGNPYLLLYDNYNQNA